MTAVADNIVSDYGLTSVDGDVEKAIDKAIKDAVEEAHNIDVASGLKQIDFYVAEEREACAKAADEFDDEDHDGQTAHCIAAAIRGRK